MGECACPVCDRSTQGFVTMCDLCGRSHDRDAARDITIAGAIHWAARRARWFARRKAADRIAALKAELAQARKRVRAVLVELAQARRDAERWREVAYMCAGPHDSTDADAWDSHFSALRQARTGTLDPEPDDDSAE